MLSICLHLLLESGPAWSLFISVPASPLSQRRERSAAHGTLRYGFQLVPDVSPTNASDPSRPLERTGSASRRSRDLRISHIPPETACPAASRFGAAPTHGQYIRNPPRTGTSPSRRGERYHHTHSRLHPASRPQTLIRSSGVMRVPSSAPQIFSNIAMLIYNTTIRNRVRLFHLTFIYYLLNPISFVIILIFKIVYLVFIPKC